MCRPTLLSGVTKKDKTRNEHARGSVKVTVLSDKEDH